VTATVSTVPLPELLTELGPLGLSGAIGGGIVAVANHLFTSRRERGAWLRGLQIKTNQEFYAAAQELLAYVVHGSADQPLTPDDATEGSYGDEIAKRRTVLNQRGLDLLPVAQESTLAVAKIATRVLPKLAYLAVPLTAMGPAPAMKQSQDAIETMGRVLEWVGAVMRDDVGLVDWRLRGAVSRYRKQLASMEVRCPIDVDGSPDLLTILRDWRVRSVTGGDDIPASLDGYRLNDLSVGGAVPEGLQPQACAVKYRGHPWQLGCCVRFQSRWRPRCSETRSVP
jgi:hypothetical protein